MPAGADVEGFNLYRAMMSRSRSSLVVSELAGCFFCPSRVRDGVALLQSNPGPSGMGVFLYRQLMELLRGDSEKLFGGSPKVKACMNAKGSVRGASA